MSILAFQYVKGAYKKERNFLPRSAVTGQRVMVLNWKRVGLDWT